jgi:SAM-dependent methyltransferase
MIFIGPGDFEVIGQKLVKQFAEYGGLRPEHRVLDIGSGIGRIAIPMTAYLNEKGSYEGFDIVKKGVDYCNKNISSRYPNFKFQHIDLRNDLYNLSTDQEASNFVFPYKDNDFDISVLTSVFTHMQEDDVVNYLEQIHRVLKPGGKCFATFFIINKEADDHLSTTDDPFFTYKYENFYLHDKNVKDANIAYKIDFLEKHIQRIGLKLANFHPGYWAGREKGKCLDFQDVLILEK